VREALVAAIDFEESLGALHADQILVFTHPQCKQLLSAMMAAEGDDPLDRVHLQVALKAPVGPGPARC